MNVVECNFINPGRNRIFSIITETMRKLTKKYDVTKVELKKNTKFYDKVQNKTKNVICKCGIDKTKIASKGRYEYIEINKFITLVKGYLSKNVIDTYMRCGNVPKLRILFFLNIANNRDYVYNFCNRPVYKIDRLCRE